MSGLLLAAKAALEFIQSIDGYENSVTAVNLRREIEAVEHSVQATGLSCRLMSVSKSLWRRLTKRSPDVGVRWRILASVFRW